MKVFEDLLRMANSVDQALSPPEKLWMCQKTIYELIAHTQIQKNAVDTNKMHTIEQFSGMPVFIDNDIPYLSFETDEERQKRINQQ